jgi:hypothetical protein
MKNSDDFDHLPRQHENDSDLKYHIGCRINRIEDQNTALVTRVHPLEAENNQLQFQKADLKEYKDYCLDGWIKLDTTL